MLRGEDRVSGLDASSICRRARMERDIEERLKPSAAAMEREARAKMEREARVVSVLSVSVSTAI